MNKLRIKKENVLYMEETDVIKIILVTKKQNGKNNILLCDKSCGIKEDDVYYYVTLSVKGKCEQHGN